MGTQDLWTVWECESGGARRTPPTHLRKAPEAQEDCKQYVFLAPNGKKVGHLSEELKALSKDFPTEFGVLKVTATEMRKLTSTQVAKESTDEAAV